MLVCLPVCFHRHIHLGPPVERLEYLVGGFPPYQKKVERSGTLYPIYLVVRLPGSPGLADHPRRRGAIRRRLAARERAVHGAFGRPKSRRPRYAP